MDQKDLGTAAVSPDTPVQVSTIGTWTITYTVGRYGIDDGGGIIITQRPMADTLAPQVDHPAGPAYVTAHTDGKASLRVWFQRRYWIRPCKDAIVVGVYDGSLTPGDTITVTIGDTSAGSPGFQLQTFPETAHEFHVLVDAFGTREYYPIAHDPAIRITPGPAQRIDAVVPSRVMPGLDVPVTVRVSDQWYNPLDTFAGTATIDAPGGAITVQLAQGVQQAGTIRFETPGVYRLHITCGELQGSSNPICVAENPRPMFWADMHGQTEQTVGTGSVEEYFSFARNKGLIDVTSWQGNDFQVTDALWDEVCRVTKAMNEPGRFVTFLGYEWSGLTPAGGDHNIIFRTDDQQIHRSSHWQIHDGSDESTDRYPLSELFDEFQGRDDVMAIAHVGGRYGNLDYWREGVSGLVEVHSHHGTFEWMMHDAVARGLVFGVVGQSDDHSGRPGMSAPLRSLPRDFATFDVFGGYTGIYADALDRDSIWQALKQRHCYATSGARILVDVHCGNAMMGDCIDHAGPVQLQCEVVGTDQLLDIDVYRDNELLYRHLAVEPSADAWLRIEWSGVRVRSRSKTADWPVRIISQGTGIEQYQEYGFRQDDETVSQVAADTLQVVSRTSGDVRGVLIRMPRHDGTIRFESPHITVDIPVADIDNRVCYFDAGGENLAVRCSWCHPDDVRTETTFTCEDESPPTARHSRFRPRDGNVRQPYPTTTSDTNLQQCGYTARHAYWLRVLQRDGHMAWTSPIFVTSA